MRRLALALVLLVPITLRAQPASAPARVTAADVWYACQAVAEAPRRTPVDSATAAFCGLTIPASGARAGWSAWTSTVVPTADEIRAYRARYDGETDSARADVGIHATLLSLIFDIREHVPALSRDPILLREAIGQLRGAARKVAGSYVGGEQLERLAASLPFDDTARIAAVLDTMASFVAPPPIVAIDTVRAPAPTEPGPPPPPPPPPPPRPTPPALVALPGVGSAAEFSSALLWGITDHVVARAQTQIQIIAVQEIGAAMCGRRSLVRSYVPTTCRLLAPDVLEELRPNLSLLRASLRADMRSIPFAVVVSAAQSGARRLDGPARERLLVLVTVADVAASLTRGEPLERALGQVAASLAAQSLWSAASPENTPAGALYQLSALYATRVEGAGQLLAQWENRTTELRYMLLALAVNARHDPRWPSRQRSAVERLFARFDPEKLVRLAAVADSAYAAVADARRAVVALTGESAPLERTRAYTALARSVIAAASTAVQSDDRWAKRADALLDALDRATRLALAEDYERLWLVVPEILEWAGTDTVRLAPTPTAMRLLSLAADIGRAESSEAVSAALAQFSEGSTGFLRKRAPGGERYITVNAYGGAAGGWERAGGRTATAAGLYLPVGLEVGWPSGHDVNLLGLTTFRTARYGLLFQLADLGALASWRFGEDDDPAENRPEVGVAQVFAPGVYLIHPIRRLPLTVGAGWSWAPELRSLKPDRQPTPGKKRFNVVRFPSVFVAFDVPLFP